tara:strand:+ start:2597 stop:3493 length:897 start_codon:yes stop_codon:yes gene_type:complete
MADLNNKKPSATYQSILNVGTNDNQTLDSTLRVIEDGRGNDSALKLSTGAIQVDNIKIDGNTITSEDTNGNIALTPNGNGDVQLGADTIRIGDNNANVTLTTYGTGDLTLNTNSGSSSGLITIADGANGDITIEPNGSGKVITSKADINGGTIDGTAIGVSSQSTVRCTTLQSDSLITAVAGINCQRDIYFTVTAFSTAGPTDNIDVSNISMLKLTTNDNSVVIGGFTGGIAGQVLFIMKYQGSNVATLEHNESHANQKIYLQSGGDETIGVAGIKTSNPMGGWVLVCDGSHWYSIGR